MIKISRKTREGLGFGVITHEDTVEALVYIRIIMTIIQLRLITTIAIYIMTHMILPSFIIQLPIIRSVLNTSSLGPNFNMRGRRLLGNSYSQSVLMESPPILSRGSSL